MSYNKYNRVRQQAEYIKSFYKEGDAFDVEGTFITTRYQNDDGFVIGTFAPKDKSYPEIVCKGMVPGFIQGAPYHISGTIIKDKVWGLQVNIRSAASITPTGPQEIVAFLGSGALPGIGPVTAKAIYKKFGENTLSILENDPSRLIEVPGIGEKTAKKLIHKLPSLLKYREIIGYFSSFGISTTTINRLINEYGAGAKNIIEKNPYILCKVRGFAFTRADQIAMKMGIEKTDMNRLYAGVVATLRYMCEKDGHTLVPRQMLLDMAYSKLGIDTREPIIDALDLLIEDERLIEDECGIHLKHLYKAEKTIRSSVQSSRKDSFLINRNDIIGLEKDSSIRLGITLTDEQLQAVDNAFSKPLSILTGGAGCGKTMSCKMIVDIARATEIPICLVSPTGRAAKHLSDICGGAPGYTMHRALAIAVHADHDDDFFADDYAETKASKMKNEATQAFSKAKIVIADEASMMDTEMAAILFRACSKKHLMLVGDPNQLPSVGPGRVLGDLIDCQTVPSVQLTKIFRQAEGSPIISAANDIIAGKSPCYEKGVIYYETDNEHVLDVFEEKIVPIIKKEKLGYEDFMVMSPIKKTMFSGVNDLNSFLRPVCNPYYKKPQDEKKEFIIQRGDYVAQKKNNYEVEIFNGDIGVVEYVTEEGSVGVSFSGSEDIVEFERDEINDNLMLAYASSIHKQQGSQAPTAIVVCTSSHFSMLNRNLLYTAVTRAEKRLILIGDKRAFAMAASNAAENKRMTGLKNIF